MPWSIWIFIALVVVLATILVIDEWLWQGKFCGCCLHRKELCNCGPDCHWCKAKGSPRVKREG